MSNFELPKKMEKAIATLAMIYNKKQSVLQPLLVNSSYYIEEQTVQDNWDGGTYGHDLYFQVPGNIFLDVYDDRGTVETKLCKDISDLIKVSNEFLNAVHLELHDNDVTDDWRKKTGVFIPSQNTVSDSELKRIWEDDRLRVFLSHKVQFKGIAENLKRDLEMYGISAFVAHTSIHPTREWENEIVNALKSMDVFVALMTDNFRESVWTDQEIGAAVARGVTIIPVRLGSIDPHGFIGRYQALNGGLPPHRGLAEAIYQSLIKSDRYGNKLQEAALQEFYNSQSYSEVFVKYILPYFPSLSDRQIKDMQKAFYENGQLHGCYVVCRSLTTSLKSATGKDFKIDGRNLISLSDSEDK